MKKIYKFKNFLSIYKFDFKNKFIKQKDFHKVLLNDAVMVVCEYNNKILILKEYRIGLKKFSWGLPGGFINKNEKASKTAIREVYEETGLKTGKVKFLTKFVRNGNYNCGIDHVYYSKVRSNKIKLEKNVRSKWLTRSEVNLYIKKNRFETPGVITALYYYLYCLD